MRILIANLVEKMKEDQQTKRHLSAQADALTIVVSGLLARMDCIQREKIRESIGGAFDAQQTVKAGASMELNMLREVTESLLRGEKDPPL
ncbi:TPA: hypothetical protein G9E63_004353 [Salmonella enterica]|uniref:Anti-adapter protein IraP n=1 Tax=Salmonella enterica TaxID=28901 RepID=A0A750H855_SALER|nr:hypothetical protein [Salmonella enterica subsp. enterica serovar Derby]EJC1546079.1 hypothetical protein [Salmonella enterica subsp. enterica serovar Montevideo]HAF6252676.1 hypothetical protein [Salmonella enterica]HAK3958919.1 hypothetical protein [Salmonella enterica]HAK8959655.1 hypothetical protein [Salmonella enterica]